MKLNLRNLLFRNKWQLKSYLSTIESWLSTTHQTNKLTLSYTTNGNTTQMSKFEFHCSRQSGNQINIDQIFIFTLENRRFKHKETYNLLTMQHIDHDLNQVFYDSKTQVQLNRMLSKFCREYESVAH